MEKTTKITFINPCSKINTNKKSLALSVNSDPLKSCLRFLLEGLEGRSEVQKPLQWLRTIKAEGKAETFSLPFPLHQNHLEDILKILIMPKEALMLLVRDGTWALVFFNISLGESNLVARDWNN